MTRPGSLHTIIPAGEHGTVKIIHDAPDMLTRLRAARDGQPLNAEKYTRLIINGKCWMTDAEFECRTSLPFERAAHGDVLVIGLGLGLGIRTILTKRSVRSVLALEINEDVIALIVPTIPHPKLRIVKGDAYSWRPPRRAFDLVYFDIWSDVPNEDNQKDLARLRRHYRASCRPGGQMMAWCEERF